MTTFSNAISDGLRNFASLNGRMSRSAFWWFALFCVLVSSCLMFIVVASNGITSGTAQFITELRIITFCYIIFVPGIRRLHDIDKSWTNALWIFLPFIGWIYVTYLYCQPSDTHENDYGSPE